MSTVVSEIKLNDDFYTLYNTIGEGAYGNVRIAMDKYSSKKIAVKIIHYSKVANESDIKKEICIHKNLKHPNIIELCGARKIEDIMYLMLEYAPHGELFDIIVPDAGIRDELAHFYFRQLISGMAYLHERGVAHRDIKPENLLLDQNSNLKIADFGLATLFRHMGKERRLDRRCGTPPYISPEVYENKEYYAMPADLWSCGIVLATLLLGCLPWDHPSMDCLEFSLFCQKKIDREPWIKICSPVKKLLRRILCVCPDNRAKLKQIREDPWFKRETNLTRQCGDNGLMRAVTLNEDYTAGRLRQDEGNIPSGKRRLLELGNFQVVNHNADDKENYNGNSHKDELLSQPDPTETFDISHDSAMNFFSQPTRSDDIYLSQRDFGNSQMSQANTQNTRLSQLSQTSKIPLLVRRMTRFMTTAEPNTILNLLTTILSTDDYRFRVNPDSLTFKITTTDQRKNPLLFIIQIFEMEGMYLVDFRRGKGDGLQFKKIFKDLRDQMKSVIA